MALSSCTWCAAVMAVVWVGVAMGSREVYELSESESQMQDSTLRLLQDPQFDPSELVRSDSLGKDLEKERSDANAAKKAQAIKLCHMGVAHALGLIQTGKIRALPEAADSVMEKSVKQAQQEEKVQNNGGASEEAEEEAEDKNSAAAKLEAKELAEETKQEQDTAKADEEEEKQNEEMKMTKVTGISIDADDSESSQDAENEAASAEKAEKAVEEEATALQVAGAKAGVQENALKKTEAALEQKEVQKENAASAKADAQEDALKETEVALKQKEDEKEKAAASEATTPAAKPATSEAATPAAKPAVKPIQLGELYGLSSPDLGEGDQVGKETIEQCHQAAIFAIKKAMAIHLKEKAKSSPEQRALASLEIEQDEKEQKKKDLSPEMKAIAEADEKAQEVNEATNPMDKAIAKVEQVDAEKAASEAAAGGKLKAAESEAAVAAVAVAQAKTPLDERKAEVQQVVADRKAQEVAPCAETVKAEKESVKTAEEVQSAKGTTSEAEKSVKAVKAAERVEHAVEAGIESKANLEVTAVKEAQQTAKQTDPQDAKLDAKQTEKTLKAIEQRPPQSQEVAAINSVDTAKQVETDVLNAAQPAQIAKDETKAVAAAKAVPATKVSATVAVAEVKAEEAAETVQKDPSKKNQEKLVSQATQLTQPRNSQHNALEVKAVQVTRAIDAQKKAAAEEQKEAVTAEEKSMVNSAQNVIVQNVLDAKKNAEKKEPQALPEKIPTVAEIRQKIEPKATVEEVTKKYNFRKAAVNLAKSPTPFGQALKAIFQAKGQDPSRDPDTGNKLSPEEADKATRQMSRDIQMMYPSKGLKGQPPGQQADPESEDAEDPAEQDLLKMEKTIEGEKIPSGGFQQAALDQTRQDAQIEQQALEAEVGDSKGGKIDEKVGLGIELESNTKAAKKEEEAVAEEEAQEKAEEKVDEQKVVGSPS